MPQEVINIDDPGASSTIAEQAGLAGQAGLEYLRGAPVRVTSIRSMIAAKVLYNIQLFE